MKVPGPTLAQTRGELAMALGEVIRSETGIPLAAMFGRCREPDVVAARHRLFFELHSSGMSMSAIGRCLGFDHTTVLAAVKKYRAVNPPKRVA